MAQHLVGRNAVVTGAGRGIGKEIAKALAAEGARVVVVDPGVARDGSGRDPCPADDVVRQIREAGGEALACYDSVADFTAAERIVRRCAERYGRLDIMVNGAGVLRERMIFNMSEDDWDTVIGVHLKGTFNMCRHSCTIMRSQGYGRIVNVTSGAWIGAVGQCNYSAAKGGIVSLTRSIAMEMARFGVTCNAIAPAAATRMTMTEEVRAGWKRGLESGTLTKAQYDEVTNLPGPENVAPLVLFLGSDAGASVTGQVFGIVGRKVSVYSTPVETRMMLKNTGKYGPWTFDELIELLPSNLLADYVSPIAAERKAGSSGANA